MTGDHKQKLIEKIKQRIAHHAEMSRYPNNWEHHAMEETFYKNILEELQDDSGER